MAVINGVNAIGTGNAIGSGTASMGSIGQKTAAQKAAEAQNKEVKAKILVAQAADAKPANGELDVGEVVKVTNANGRVEYYVGTYDGKVSKPLTTVNSARDAVTNAYKKAEQVQTVALRTSHKIEEAELKAELKDLGVDPKEITRIVKEERVANTSELAQYKSLLAEPMLQYGVRNPATNTFVNNTVNGVTTKAPPPSSLLTYNDPLYAPQVTESITKANDSVAEFQLAHGITQSYLGKGNTQTGLDPVAIYKALKNNSIETVRDPVTNAVIDYKFSPEVLKAKGDQSGLMDAAGIGKYEARALGQILSTDSLIGGKVNFTEKNGQYYVNSSDGTDRYGKQSALVDTGQLTDTGKKDANGQPILGKVFAEVATDDSKRNKVSVVTNYVQQPDGTFTFGGVDDMSYTHIEGFNPISALVKAGLTYAAAVAIPPLAGLTTTVNGVTTATTAGKIAAGMGAGAFNSALSGNNIIKGGLLGGLTGYGMAELQAAADAAGGWTKLLDKTGIDFSSFVDQANNLVPTTTPIDTSVTQSVTDIGSSVAPSTSIAPPADTLSNAANTANNLSSYANGNTLAGDFVQGTGAFADTAKAALTNSGTGLPAAYYNGQSLATDFINAAYPNTPSVLGLEQGTLPTRDLSNSNFNTDGSPYLGNPSATGSLLDDAIDKGKEAWATLPAWGQIALLGGGAKLGKDLIGNLLTPDPKEVTYPSFTLKNPTNAGAGGLPTTMPDWWNNLYARQGVGAGQYLGYDIMKGLNIPTDVMSLLGSSAPTAPTTPVAA